MTEQSLHDRTAYLASLLRLDGRTAVVTGAAMGIGRAIASELARAGASVLLADADAEAVELAVKELQESGLAARGIRADVSSEADAGRLVEEATRWTGRLDILVNNAGIFPAVPVLDMSAEAFARVVDVNLTGVYLCSRAAAREMVALGHGGRIINVTSVDALHPSSVGLAHYDASKHGVWGFTKNLALELAPHRIWVNAVAPGGILTPGASHMAPAPGVDPDELMRQFQSRIPMGRMGEPIEIAHVVLFLAGELASYMTGSQVVVDGGVLLA